MIWLWLFVPAAKHQENLLIERIEELRHHIRIESAVQEGSQNMLKHLKVLKSVDKKALQEVKSLAYIIIVMILEIDICTKQSRSCHIYIHWYFKISMDCFFPVQFVYYFPSVLWRCWLDIKTDIQWLQSIKNCSSCLQSFLETFGGSLTNAVKCWKWL